MQRQLAIVGPSPTIFVPVLREQISRGISSMLDNLALFGTGPANGQPLGVFSAVTPVNLAATPMTWVNYQSYRQTILQTDLDPDTFGGIMSPAFLNYADQTQAYGAGILTVSGKKCSTGIRIVSSSAMRSTHRRRWRLAKESFWDFGGFCTS